MNQREMGAKKEEQAGEYLKSCGYELEAKNYYCRFARLTLLPEKESIFALSRLNIGKMKNTVRRKVLFRPRK